jgi:7,8-dihydro-6-hydroxymethylpterin-pyrophosphokinase
LPDELLDRLKGIESRLGREKEAQANSPRPMDLDIIFYSDVVITGGRIKIPHPRTHEREFVLRGLVEIAPDFMHPRLNKTLRQLYDELKTAHGNNNGSPADAAVQQSPEAAA